MNKPNISGNVECKCGAWIKPAGQKNHERGQQHVCGMTEVEATRKGHTYELGERGLGHGRAAALLMQAGYSSRFSIVKRHKPRVYNWETKKYEAITESVVKCAPQMILLLTRFASNVDDVPELTMHAALVFHELYGDDAPHILLGVIDNDFGVLHEDTNTGIENVMLWRGSHAEPQVNHETALVGILRANGVQNPARAFVNLLPHLLFAAAEKYK